MNLEMWFVNFFGGGGGRFMESPPVVCNFNGDTEITTEELFEKMCGTSRISLEEVRSHPHGHIFDVEAVVEDKDPDCTAKLDVGNAVMLGELAEYFGRDYRSDGVDADFPFRLIPRRHNNFMNSSGISLTKLNKGKAYNPTYMHPDSIAALGLKSGDVVTVTSPHDSIPSVVEADDTLRPDVVATHHAFGGLPAEDGQILEQGSTVGRLIPTEHDYDHITGLPRQGNIPVRISART
jgi:anaerobic selenocysteine-containing dehydrogenase